MAISRKRDAPAGAPDWMVTYGDMMTLLLCFFVILVSMSEIKKDDKFLQVVESIRDAFGFEALVGQIPIASISKNSLLEQLQKVIVPIHELNEGDSDDEGIEGRVFRVTNVREGIKVVIGGRITFDRFRTRLRPEARELIAKAAEKIAGHNTKINVRGHATLEPLPEDSPYADPMALSYARGRVVADALVANGVRRARLRIEACGAEEPIYRQAYTEERRAVNRRVEIVVTEALIDEYAGEPLPIEATGVLDAGR